VSGLTEAAGGGLSSVILNWKRKKKLFKKIIIFNLICWCCSCRLTMIIKEKEMKEDNTRNQHMQVYIKQI